MKKLFLFTLLCGSLSNFAQTTLTYTSSGVTVGGNLGINTTSPASILDVRASSGNKAEIRLGGSGSFNTDNSITVGRTASFSEYLRIGSASGTGGLFGGANNSYFVDVVGGSAGTARPVYYRFSQDNGTTYSTALTVSTSGVGIGTATPTAKLQVNGDIKFGSGTDLQTALDLKANLASPTFTGTVTIGSLYNTATQINCGYNVNNDTQDAWLNYAGYLGGFTNYRNWNIGNGRGVAVLSVVGSTGNIGINKISPAYNLDVAGTAQVTIFRVSAIQTAPETATSTGITGEIRFTSTGIYICTATNTWIRCTGATF